MGLSNSSLHLFGVLVANAHRDLGREGVRVVLDGVGPDALQVLLDDRRVADEVVREIFPLDLVRVSRIDHVENFRQVLHQLPLAVRQPGLPLQHVLLQRRDELRIRLVTVVGLPLLWSCDPCSCCRIPS